MSTEEKVIKVLAGLILFEEFNTKDAVLKIMSIIEEEKAASYVEGARDGEILSKTINTQTKDAHYRP